MKTVYRLGANFTTLIIKNIKSKILICDALLPIMKNGGFIDLL